MSKKQFLAHMFDRSEFSELELYMPAEICPILYSNVGGN